MFVSVLSGGNDLGVYIHTYARSYTKTYTYLIANQQCVINGSNIPI